MDEYFILSEPFLSLYGLLSMTVIAHIQMDKQIAFSAAPDIFDDFAGFFSSPEPKAQGELL